jgi:hypothetical protein
MPAWTDTIDESTDWSDLDFLSMFRDAVNERTRAANGAAIRSFSLGNDVQHASHGSLATIRYLQEEVDAVVGNYIPIDIDMSTLGESDSPAYTTATFRTAAGLHADGWRRKRPREISSLSAAADTQGNARATNQRAIYTDGLVYKFNGTSWILDVGRPDTLDSDSAAPDHVVPGYVTAGDYIGPWLFNELRDACNVLLWFHDAGSPLNFVRRAREGLDTTWALAKTAAEADPVPVDGTGLPGMVHGTQGATNFDGSDFTAIRYSCRIDPEAFVWEKVNCEVSVWVWFEAYGTWDANGATLTEDAFSEIVADEAVSGTSTDTLSTATLTSFRGLDDTPTWCDEPSIGTPTQRGNKSTAYYIVIVKYNVAGGFTYQPGIGIEGGLLLLLGGL